MQAELPTLSGAKFVETAQGGIAAEVTLKGEKRTFTAEQIAAMLLTDLKKTCETSTTVPMADVCVAVPGFWTTRQRRSMIDAGKIAGMNIVGLINDLSAAALSWGFYRTDLATGSKKVLFLGMGSSYFGASIVEFTHSQATVLASSYETQLGGDEIDLAIAQRFAKNFGDKNKVNVQGNQRAWFRLLTTIERVKKNLNENPSTGFSIESFMDDKDLSDKLTRDEYVDLLKNMGVFDRVRATITKAMTGANVTKEQLDDVEWVGSAMRIVPIRDDLQAFFGRRVSNSMNAEEAVVKGAALYCAMLSPLFKVLFFDTQPRP